MGLVPLFPSTTEQLSMTAAGIGAAQTRSFNMTQTSGPIAAARSGYPSPLKSATTSWRMEGAGSTWKDMDAERAPPPSPSRTDKTLPGRQESEQMTSSFPSRLKSATAGVLLPI